LRLVGLSAAKALGKGRSRALAFPFRQLMIAP
jgi:hypothetical protein